MLNSDIKILAKALARRLESVTDEVISPDQTGFMSGRHSFSNIRSLLNVIYSPASGGVPEVVISLDAEKAFDRVECAYLFECLQAFGFGPVFIAWIKPLYASPKASVVTNGKRYEFFSLSRGTRQGCPLNPLLFALAIEPLSIMLKSSSEIIGISRWGREHKVALYADDLLLYVSDPVRCVSHIVQVLHRVGIFSGYKTNLMKIECFPVNNLALAIPQKDLPFHLAKSGFKTTSV